MKRHLVLVLAALVATAAVLPVSAQEPTASPAPAVEAPAAPAPFTIGEGDDATEYDLADADSAQAFVDA